MAGNNDKTRRQFLWREYDFAPWGKEGRALAGLLAKDNLLYRLRRLLEIRISRHEEDDFDHDFFLSVVRNAEKYPETFVGIEDLEECEHGIQWLFTCCQRFKRNYWRRKLRRIHKRYNFPRAQEILFGDMRIFDLGREAYLRSRNLLFVEDEVEMADYITHLRKTLDKAMRLLSKKQKKIMQMYYYESLKTPSIAKKVGMKATNVIMHIVRARKKMREHLPEEVFSSIGWIRTDCK
jgi:RNA polymerase sigma factor (sigma-70 family)